MHYILLTLITLFSLGCRVSPSEKLNNSTRLNDNQTILETPQGMEWIFEKNYKNWIPAESDIETAEKLLADCFEKQKSGTVNRLDKRTLDEYCRQFVGAEYVNGDKVIWVNCFCKSQTGSFKDCKRRRQLFFQCYFKYF